MAGSFKTFLLAAVLTLIAVAQCEPEEPVPGESCATPEGTIILKGQTVMENGQECACVGSDTDALCLTPKDSYGTSDSDDDDDEDGDNTVVITNNDGQTDDDEEEEGKKSKLPEEGTPEWVQLKQERMARRKEVAQKFFAKKKAKMLAKSQKRKEKRREKAAKLKARRIAERKEQKEKMKELKQQAKEKAEGTSDGP